MVLHNLKINVKYIFFQKKKYYKTFCFVWSMKLWLTFYFQSNLFNSLCATLAAPIAAIKERPIEITVPVLLMKIKWTNFVDFDFCLFFFKKKKIYQSSLPLLAASPRTEQSKVADFFLNAKKLFKIYISQSMTNVSNLAQRPKMCPKRNLWLAHQVQPKPKKQVQMEQLAFSIF